MKIFAAGGPQTETNTFCTLTTTLQMYHDAYLAHQGEDRHNSNFWALPNQVWSTLAAQYGDQYIESLRAGAEPAGVTERAVYEQLRDEVLEDLQRAMPVDMVLLNLHGAMVAEGYSDCEGDMLGKIRHIVGAKVPIGLELDLHANVSNAMLEYADIIVLFKEYPHIDVAERAAEVFRLTRRLATGEIIAHITAATANMVNLFPTQDQPMQRVVNKMRQLEQEREAVLSISLAHGFPWGDNCDLTAKFIVITDNAPELGNQLANDLAAELYQMREALRFKLPTINDALQIFQQHQIAHSGDKKMTFGDFADNPGGGGIGDATFILDAVLAANITRAVFLTIWDPQTVDRACEVGINHTFDAVLGGRHGATSGKPVCRPAKVLRIIENLEQEFAGSTLSLGRAVALEISGNIIIVNSVRSQIYSYSLLLALGFDLAQFDLFVVKSSIHFESCFSELGATLRVASPGALNTDFSQLDYQLTPKQQWPFQ